VAATPPARAPAPCFCGAHNPANRRLSPGATDAASEVSPKHGGCHGDSDGPSPGDGEGAGGIEQGLDCRPSGRIGELVEEATDQGSPEPAGAGPVHSRPVLRKVIATPAADQANGPGRGNKLQA